MTVAAALALALMVGDVADALLLHPSRREVPVEARRMSFAVPDGLVEVWIRSSPGGRGVSPEAFDLEFCGNASRAERMIERWSDRWRDRPVEVWAVNYPGFGGSSGAATLDGCIAAADAAFELLSAEAEGRPVFVGGSSIGTTVALHLSATRDVAGVVVRNPPPLREMILWKHGWWNLWLLSTPLALQVPSRLDSTTNAGRSRAPMVLLSGRGDSVVPTAYQRRVFDAYGGRKTWVEYVGSHSARLRSEDLAAYHRAMGGLFDEVTAVVLPR